MDINRTNEAGPSRQPTNEGDEAANPNPPIPIVAVQQAAAEGAVTTRPPGPIRESVIRRVVDRRVSVITHTARATGVRRHVLVPEPARANPNEAPRQNTGDFFRPWMAADPTSTPHVNAESAPNPTPHPDERAGPSGYVSHEQHRALQPTLRLVFDPNASGPSRVQPFYVPLEQHRALQPALRLVFVPNIAGPSTARPSAAPQGLLTRRLPNNAYPPEVKLRALELSKTLSAGKVADQLKIEFPDRSPRQQIVSLWIKQHEREIEREVTRTRVREAERAAARAQKDNTSESDSD